MNKGFWWWLFWLALETSNDVLVWKADIMMQPPINTSAASRLADAYFCLICNLRQFYFVFHIFAKRYIICSERPMSVGETRKQPKLHFVFKPSTKLKLSQFDPLAVWLEIRDICQRLNRDRVLGNFPKGVLCFMNSDIVWFSMPTQT